MQGQMLRVRGKVGTGDDGKFYFEMSLWNFEGTKMVGEPFPPCGPYDTKEIAGQHLQTAAELVCKKMAEKEGLKPEGFVDFKDEGKFKKFSE